MMSHPSPSLPPSSSFVMLALTPLSLSPNSFLLSPNPPLPSIALGSFSPSPFPIGPSRFEYSDSCSWVSIVDSARAQNITQLILDVTGNPGGSICVGYEFVRRLSNQTFPYAVGDIIHSNMSEAMIEYVRIALSSIHLTKLPPMPSPSSSFLIRHEQNYPRLPPSSRLISFSPSFASSSLLLSFPPLS